MQLHIESGPLREWNNEKVTLPLHHTSRYNSELFLAFPKFLVSSLLLPALPLPTCLHRAKLSQGRHFILAAVKHPNRQTDRQTHKRTHTAYKDEWRDNWGKKKVKLWLGPNGCCCLGLFMYHVRSVQVWNNRRLWWLLLLERLKEGDERCKLKPDAHAIKLNIQTCLQLQPSSMHVRTYVVIALTLDQIRVWVTAMVK